MINVNLTMREVLDIPLHATKKQYIEAVISAIGYEKLKELIPYDMETLTAMYIVDPDCRFIRNWPCSFIVLKTMCAELGAYKGVGNGLEVDVIKTCIRRAVEEFTKNTTSETLDKDHVLNALKDVYFANAGDASTENIIVALTADIFKTSQEKAKTILAG